MEFLELKEPPYTNLVRLSYANGNTQVKMDDKEYTGDTYSKYLTAYVKEIFIEVNGILF